MYLTFCLCFTEPEGYFLVLTESEKEAYLCGQETSRKIKVIALKTFQDMSNLLKNKNILMHAAITVLMCHVGVKLPNKKPWNKMERTQS